ncbi:MAG: hypothetical protein OSJ28_11485, partial [Desulfovibrio sp.]|nr:hypothetical protein [Desulfovibrio sp.]
DNHVPAPDKCVPQYDKLLFLLIDKIVPASISIYFNWLYPEKQELPYSRRTNLSPKNINIFP